MIRVSAKDPVRTAFSFDPMPITLRSTHRRISWPPCGMVALSSAHWHPSRAFAVDALVPDRSRTCTRKQAKHYSGLLWWHCSSPSARVWSSCRQNVWEKARSGLVGSAPHCPTCPTWGCHSHHIILWARQLKTLFSVHWHVVSRKLVRCEPPTAADGM